MLDFVVNPLRSSLRSFLGIAEHEAAETTPVQKTEEDLPAVAHAIKGVTESIEHNVAVIEQLAEQLTTTVGPLKDSVDNLTATMTDLLKLLGPIAAAERGVHDVEHFFGRHRHHPDAPDSHRD
jgi:hypothetical protein